jgi:hypothetical protein
MGIALPSLVYGSDKASRQWNEVCTFGRVVWYDLQLNEKGVSRNSVVQGGVYT